MSMTDPIADYLTRIRNAIQANHPVAVIPASRFKVEITRILREQGYIADYEVRPGVPGDAADKLVITLKYTDDRSSVISGIRRASRPGQRLYVDAKHIPKVLGGMGTAIMSTSRGVMTGHDARALGIGGEVVAEVW